MFHKAITPEISACEICPIGNFGTCTFACARTVEEFFARGKVCTYQASQTIWDAQTTAGFWGVLTAGYLRLLHYGFDGRRQIVSLMMPGDIISKAQDCSKGFVLEASTDAVICQFDDAIVRQTLIGSPDFARAVYKMRMNKLDQLRLLTWALGTLTAEERICAFLAITTRFMPFRPGLDGSGILTIELPRPDIADLIGTSVETISRITRRLAGEGLIRIRSPRTFEIPDVPELARRGCVETIFETQVFPMRARVGRAQMSPASDDSIRITDTLTARSGAPRASTPVRADCAPKRSGHVAAALDRRQ